MASFPFHRTSPQHLPPAPPQTSSPLSPCLLHFTHPPTLDISQFRVSPAIFTMGRVLQKWDPETHEDIMLVVVKHFSPKAEDWRAIVARLQQMGHTFTESALQYVVV